MPTTHDPTALLLDLMNLGPSGAIDICRTSDGHYLGQLPDDIGYNMFLGQPSQTEGPGRKRSRATWDNWTPEQRQAVMTRCAAPLDGAPIPLSDFGVIP